MKHLLKFIFISLCVHFRECRKQSVDENEAQFTEFLNQPRTGGSQNPIYVYGVPIFPTNDGIESRNDLKHFSSVILLLLSHVTWNDHKNMFLQCSRDKSRIVRNIVYKKFIPVLDRYRVSMPIDCPFHPQRDFLWWPEYEIDDEYDEPIAHWFCPFCGTTFLCAETLAIHWDETHRIEINNPEDSVCLADYCDIMRCDVIAGRKRKTKTKTKAKTKFNISPKNQKESSSVARYCNSTEMKLLEERCNYVVHQCTVGLLTKVSFKDFLEIKDDLIRLICSYLTCDKFYEDYSKEPRLVPLTLCVIIGIIMIGGFCLCYYIVWMLFDAGLNSRQALMYGMENKEQRFLYNKNDKLEENTRSGNTSNGDRIPASDRPKILVTSNSSQRISRAQPLHYYYHSNRPRYHRVDEEWESASENVASKTVPNAAAVAHSSGSRTSSNTDKSNLSTPYR